MTTRSGQKHELEIIDMFNKDGTLNENAQFYIGQDRFEARKSILRDLEKQDRIVKVEEIANKVGYSERTDAVIEPRLSLQWFCSMDKMAKPALENVMNDEIQFHPAKFKNSYRHWMENIRDWCISQTAYGGDSAFQPGIMVRELKNMLSPKQKSRPLKKREKNPGKI
ncbi:MAG: class I tRNA ligase family protein [Balneolaceae bacterium]|nr:class I tRNA ligase family protein [Balneolaceae bacterium]